MDWTVAIEPEPQKNDANAFVMPRRNNNAVARTKMTPNDTGMCIDVIKRSYMIYLRCLKIFCMRTLVFWSRFTKIAEFACRGLEQKQQLTRSEALLRASRTCLDREGSVAWKNVLLHFSPQNVLVHLGRSQLILLEFVGVVI